MKQNTVKIILSILFSALLPGCKQPVSNPVEMHVKINTVPNKECSEIRLYYGFRDGDLMKIHGSGLLDGGDCVVYFSRDRPEAAQCLLLLNTKNRRVILFSPVDYPIRIDVSLDDEDLVLTYPGDRNRPLTSKSFVKK